MRRRGAMRPAAIIMNIGAPTARTRKNTRLWESMASGFFTARNNPPQTAANTQHKAVEMNIVRRLN